MFSKYFKEFKSSVKPYYARSGHGTPRLHPTNMSLLQYLGMYSLDRPAKAFLEDFVGAMIETNDRHCLTGLVRSCFYRMLYCNIKHEKSKENSQDNYME